MDPRKKPPPKPQQQTSVIQEVNNTVNNSTRSRSISHSPERKQQSANHAQVQQQSWDQMQKQQQQQQLYQNQEFTMGYNINQNFQSFHNQGQIQYNPNQQHYQNYSNSSYASKDLSAEELLKQYQNELELQAKKEASGEIPIGPKHERQLYVGNLPPTITHQKLVELLNIAVCVMKLNVKPGQPILSAWISQDGHYAFVEFRTIEECMNGHQLNQIAIQGHPLKVGKTRIQNQINSQNPHNFPCQNSANQQVLMLSQALSNSIEISNIPKFYENDTEALVKLLKMFGVYRQYQMKALQTQIICYCEYESDEQTKKALNGFNDLLVKESKLQVRRLPNGHASQIFGSTTAKSIDCIQGNQKSSDEPRSSRVVVLNNLLVLENMKTKQEFYEVEDDIREECEKYGKIRQVMIPKPSHLSHRQKLPFCIQIQRYGSYLVNEGAGKIYVKFDKSEQAKKCVEQMNKRLYNQREVIASLYSEDKWYDRILE